VIALWNVILIDTKTVCPAKETHHRLWPARLATLSYRHVTSLNFGSISSGADSSCSAPASIPFWAVVVFTHLHPEQGSLHSWTSNFTTVRPSRPHSSTSCHPLSTANSYLIAALPYINGVWLAYELIWADYHELCL